MNRCGFKTWMNIQQNTIVDRMMYNKSTAIRMMFDPVGKLDEKLEVLYLPSISLSRCNNICGILFIAT